jgi:chitin disaccharide deacetylase
MKVKYPGPDLRDRQKTLVVFWRMVILMAESEFCRFRELPFDEGKLMKHITIVGALVIVLSATAFGQGAATMQATPAATPSLVERLGYPRDAKLLIVHVDDLGMAHTIDAAATKAFASGLVTSGSIMVPCPWFTEIAAYARSHPDADLGLHLTLTSEWRLYRWGPVAAKDRVASLLDSEGYFYPTETEAAAHINAQEAEAEIRAQIDRARAFGIKPTHLDSHMGTLYQNKVLFETLLRVARENKLPVRIAREELASSPLSSAISPDDILLDRIITIEPSVAPEHWTDFYAEAIKHLQPGVTEFVIHLAYDDEEMRAVAAEHPNWGAAWRQRDFDFFTSNAFRQLLQEHHIQLITWRKLDSLLAH